MNNKLFKLEYIRQNQDARGLATATLSVRDSDSTLIAFAANFKFGMVFHRLFSLRLTCTEHLS